MSQIPEEKLAEHGYVREQHPNGTVSVHQVGAKSGVQHSIPNVTASQIDARKVKASRLPMGAIRNQRHFPARTPLSVVTPPPLIPESSLERAGEMMQRPFGSIPDLLAYAGARMEVIGPNELTRLGLNNIYEKYLRRKKDWLKRDDIDGFSEILRIQCNVPAMERIPAILLPFPCALADGIAHETFEWDNVQRLFLHEKEWKLILAPLLPLQPLKDFDISANANVATFAERAFFGLLLRKLHQQTFDGPELVFFRDAEGKKNGVLTGLSFVEQNGQVIARQVPCSDTTHVCAFPDL
jgi:hypothetical protein